MSNEWKVLEKRDDPRHLVQDAASRYPHLAGLDEHVYVVEQLDTGELEEVYAKRALEVGEHISDSDFIRQE